MKNSHKIIFLIAIVSLILGGCYEKQPLEIISPEALPQHPHEAIDDVSNTSREALIEIQITAVGDIMVHRPQLTAQYNLSDGSYCFKNNFKYVKPYLQKADLVLGNLETTFGGDKRGYSGYPMFNTPDALAAALKYSGFHGLSTANNHSYDTGKNGLIRTLEVLERENLLAFGTRRNTDEDSFVVVDVKGIRVGIVAYTYETPRFGRYKTINSIILPKEIEDLIDTFSYESMEEDLLIIEERIKKVKAAGSEVIVMFVHWGNEYSHTPNNYQRNMAQALINYGAHIIFGSHPHVIQPIERIKAQQGNHEGVVVYSLGNFISNQRYETLKNRRTEDGVMVNVTVAKNPNSQDISIKKLTYTPTWVHRYFNNGRYVYEILPLPEAIVKNKEFSLKLGEINRAIDSKNATKDIIESGSIEISIAPIPMKPQDIIGITKN